MEFWEDFYNVYSNKVVKAFKEKNIKNFSSNCLNTLSIDYLSNKISNINNSNIINNNNEMNKIFFPKIGSEHSLNFIDDTKKLINDNKMIEWNENINNNGDIFYPKFNFFGNPSFNNLANPDSYYNFKNLGSKSFSNGINNVPSFANINNYNNLSNNNFTPNKNSFLGLYMNNSLNSMSSLNQLNNMNMNINTLKNSNQNLLNNSNHNLPLLNKESFVK